MTLEVDRRLFLALGLTLLMGCGTASKPFGYVPVARAPLASGDVKLIDVVSEDLSDNESADFNRVTVNLTNQRLQPTLSMGSYLRRNVRGNENGTEIYALGPITHLQTVSQFSNVAGNRASILTVSNGSGPTAT